MRRTITPKNLGYDEVFVVQHRKRRTRPLERLYSVTREVEEGNPGFYVKMQIMVPHPSFDNPYPCVFVLIQNATSKLWFRLKSLEDLKAFFGLNEQDLTGLAKALEKAKALAEGLKQGQGIISRELENISRELEKD